ncbi:hypothetical protein GQ600_8131 [Phytophthora cactorum]|nr:hypothetical protein GQ600_8131 [Phytophthora cactorum]
MIKTAKENPDTGKMALDTKRALLLYQITANKKESLFGAVPVLRYTRRYESDSDDGWPSLRFANRKKAPGLPARDDISIYQFHAQLVVLTFSHQDLSHVSKQADERPAAADLPPQSRQSMIESGPACVMTAQPVSTTAYTVSGND